MSTTHLNDDRMTGPTIQAVINCYSEWSSLVFHHHHHPCWAPLPPLRTRFLSLDESSFRLCLSSVPIGRPGCPRVSPVKTSCTFLILAPLTCQARFPGKLAPSRALPHCILQAVLRATRARAEGKNITLSEGGSIAVCCSYFIGLIPQTDSRVKYESTRL